MANVSYSSSQCISRCFLAALYAHTGCLMPYMHGEFTADASHTLEFSVWVTISTQGMMAV